MEAIIALHHIQQTLKAPKNQKNNFGGYNYRSCEDILEAVKPLCAEYGALVLLQDEVVNIGMHNYVKATAKFVIGPSEIVEVSAFAREAENKKGMDDSQITGSTSSYARKYALNGLFAIDDTKDSDATNTGNTPPRSVEPKKPALNDNQIKSAAEMATSVIDLTKLYKSLTPAQQETHKQLFTTRKEVITKEKSE